MVAASLVALVVLAGPEGPSKEQLSSVLVEVPGFQRKVDAWRRGDLRGADGKYTTADGVTVSAHVLWDEGLPIPLEINKKTGNFAHCEYGMLSEQRVLVCKKQYGSDRSALYWARPGASLTVAIHVPSALAEKAAADLVLKVATVLVRESVQRLP